MFSLQTFLGERFILPLALWPLGFYLPAERRQKMLDWLADGPDDGPAPLTIRKARKATLRWIDGPLRIDDQVFDAPELASNIIVELEPDGLRVCVPARQD